MSLPIIPRTKRTWKPEHYPKTIEYQAFNIGLQTILLQVSDEDTPPQERIEALRQVVEGCVVNLTKEEIGKLPIFIIEQLFLKIRSISVSGVVNLKFKCNRDVDGTACNTPMSLELDLDNIKLKEYEGHVNKIEEGDYTFILQYPNLDTTATVPDEATPSDIVMLFLDKICTKDGEVWDFADYSRADQLAFVEQLGISFQKRVMEDFFMKQPHIHFETNMKCPKCGHEHKMTFSNLNQVFM